MKFIYKIIDPFINACWHKYAIDYDEDSDPYVNFLPVLIYYEIKFIISPGAARCHEYWEEALQETSQEYREIMQKRLREALKEEPPCN